MPDDECQGWELNRGSEINTVVDTVVGVFSVVAAGYCVEVIMLPAWGSGR